MQRRKFLAGLLGAPAAVPAAVAATHTAALSAESVVRMDRLVRMDPAGVLYETSGFAVRPADLSWVKVRQFKPGELDQLVDHIVRHMKARGYA